MAGAPQPGRPEGRALQSAACQVSCLGNSCDELISLYGVDCNVLETTLGRAVEDVARAEFKAPAIIVIGDVVKLREGLDWLGALESRILKRDPLGLRGIEDAG